MTAPELPDGWEWEGVPPYGGTASAPHRVAGLSYAWSVSTAGLPVSLGDFVGTCEVSKGGDHLGKGSEAELARRAALERDFPDVVDAINVWLEPRGRC